MAVDSADELADALKRLFPKFTAELEAPVADYHQVLRLLSGRLAAYLEASSTTVVEEFCALVNGMVAAGGDAENAISTCILEHATQIRVLKVLKPHLSEEASAELR